MSIEDTRINERNKIIDVIKGYGICLMVCGHSGAPFRNLIYLFHMALFFLASGYLWKDRNAMTRGGILHYVEKKVKSLWLPFVLINMFFTITQNWFLKIGIYSADQTPSVLPMTSLETNDVIKKLLANFFFAVEVSWLVLHGSLGRYFA